MARTVSRLGLLAIALMLVPACGGGRGSAGGSSSLGSLILTCSGGSALGSSVPGTANGGNFTYQNLWCSNGDILIGVDPPPSPPSPEEPPSTGTIVAALDSDQTVARGNALVPGTLLGSGAASRTITSSEGDIVVSGTINSGQNAGTQINLTLSAPNGTVYITGVVRTASVDGVPSGNSAGTLTITARRIVVSGLIDATGEDNPVSDAGTGGSVTLSVGAGGSDLIVTGSIITKGGSSTIRNAGAGGAISLTAPNDVIVSGTLTTSGGSSRAAINSPLGGSAGGVSIVGSSRVILLGQIAQDGGSSTGSGTGAMAGNGGAFAINTTAAPSGAVYVYGSWSSNGGDASAAAGSGADPINGGIASAMTIGTFMSSNCPALIEMGTLTIAARGGDSSDQGGSVGSPFEAAALGKSGNVTAFAAVDASGGSGVNSGGHGGAAITIITGAGDIEVTGTFIARGGDSALKPGQGSIFNALQSGTAGLAGNISFSGMIDQSGGSSTATAGTSSPGGNGGTVLLTAAAPTSSITIAPGSILVSDGGASTGSGQAGNGGLIRIFTRDQKILLGGSYLARGGQAAGTGGAGGNGGGVLVTSDSNGDGVAGDITLEIGAFMDVSAGSGTATVPLGGDVQFIADNNTNAPTNGIILNLGFIVARGGSPNGNGGNVTFNGLKADGVTVGPDPGSQDRSGSGSGVSGTFTSM